MNNLEGMEGMVEVLESWVKFLCKAMMGGICDGGIYVEGCAYWCEVVGRWVYVMAGTGVGNVFKRLASHREEMVEILGLLESCGKVGPPLFKPLYNGDYEFCLSNRFCGGVRCWNCIMGAYMEHRDGDNLYCGDLAYDFGLYEDYIFLGNEDSVTVKRGSPFIKVLDWFRYYVGLLDRVEVFMREFFSGIDCAYLVGGECMEVGRVCNNCKEGVV